MPLAMVILLRNFAIIRTATKRHVQYCSVREALPKVPVPDLEKTLLRYVEYATVVADGQGKNPEVTKKAAEKFLVEGRPLQQRLLEIAAKNTNWVNLFWLPEMYLRARQPLPVNSSAARVFPQQKFNTTYEQLRYATLLVRGIVEFKDDIDNGRLLERELSSGQTKQPMCMVQYDRILGCYRQPSRGEDVQIMRPKGHLANEHIALMVKNQAFIVRTRIDGELVSAAQILKQFEEAMRMANNRPAEVVVSVAAASVGERDLAGDCWTEMSQVEKNRCSLDAMQHSLFTVCLDEYNNQRENNNEPIETNSEANLAERGMHILTGGGSAACGLNRWYDGTINVVVRSDGISGLLLEHSSAESIVLAHMGEIVLRFVEKNQNKEMLSPTTPRINVKKLTWDISEKAAVLMKTQIKQFDELHNELQLEFLNFRAYGKEAIKRWKVSPDGFVQLALQLAHYRMHGYLVSSYESASIRRFAEGRVDNIRANTNEALEWVRAMVKNGVAKEKRLQLFRAAAAKQAIVTLENISGEGIDNHLCALRCIAEQTGMRPLPDLFADPLWPELMRFPLSTSQVKASTDLDGFHGCYGAVVRDGYGCAYSLLPNRIIFASSAFKSDPRTDILAFKSAISNACLEMQQLLAPNSNFRSKLISNYHVVATGKTLAK